MPRPDRGVAQRYAARKRKKRASGGRLSSAVVAQPNKPVAALVEQPAAVAAATPAPTAVLRSVASAERLSTGPGQRSPSARPFSSYANEYRYVFGDLRRVGLVAGSLLLSLVVLSFFIR